MHQFPQSDCLTTSAINFHDVKQQQWITSVNGLKANRLQSLNQTPHHLRSEELFDRFGPNSTLYLICRNTAELLDIIVMADKENGKHFDGDRKIEIEKSKSVTIKGGKGAECESPTSDRSEEDDLKNGRESTRGRCLSSESGSDEELANRKTDSEKRPRVDMSPQGFMLPGSPPRFVSLEQIMKAANGVTNMALAHEIAVDKDFKLEKVEPPEDSLERQIKETVHKAFWDAFAEQLTESPANYQHAMILLNEIKEGLLSLLLPHHTKIKEQINEVLDVDLIHHQAENDALDFNYYAQYIISVMAKLCAPIRDEKIRELMTITDVVAMYREILKTLDVMKLDMANFTIQQMRPHIQQHSIEYEKEKFAEFLDTQVNGLQYTKCWFQRIVDELNIKHVMEPAMPGDASTEKILSTNNVIMKAYCALLEWNDDWIFPETLLMDKSRFFDLRKRVQNISLIASMLLVTFSSVGPSISGLTHFKEQLKEHVTVLLNSAELSSLNETTSNVAIQVVKEVNECLGKHGFKPLDESAQKGLTGQIEELALPNARIRGLVRLRILEFIGQVLGSTASPIRIPPGLSTMQQELSRVAGQFLRLVSHNRSVFGDYYVDIITELTGNRVTSQKTNCKSSEVVESNLKLTQYFQDL
uniref:T-complex protein 11-like protein 1 n=1 Tax=Strigamia maritima TaxID=126957 RepID=T1IQ07_STRMM